MARREKVKREGRRNADGRKGTSSMTHWMIGTDTDRQSRRFKGR